MATKNITCAFDDPSSDAITTGTLLFVADLTTPPVLKGTSITGTPGITGVDLEPGTYKVYYTPVGGVKKLVGDIIIAADTPDPTTLVSLLAV